MITKADYEAIAAILAGDLATSNEAERIKVTAITYSLADYFTRTNPRFNRAIFYRKAGVR